METNSKKYSFYTLIIILLAMFIGGYQTCAQPTITLMPIDGNWYTWTVDDGILYDDGDVGGNYTNNGLGALTIYPTDQTSDKIYLRFLEFRVENHSSCNYDYLEVYDGEDFTTLIGKYCGTSLPDVVQSTHSTGAVTLLWSSDGSVVDAGFKIDVSVIDPSWVVELGDRNSQSTDGRVPSYGYYDYSWSGLMWGQADMGVPIIIENISFDVVNDINTTINNQKIYLAHTSANMFPNGTEPTDGSGPWTDWTLVYTGNITWTQGWNNIALDAPFVYNGAEGLLVKTVNEDGSWVSTYPQYRYTSRANTVVYNYADGAFPGPSGFRNSLRPNMRFGFGGGGALPIVLMSFTGEVNDNNNVNLNWVVASQVNNDYFTIERSLDCREWEVVENLNGAGNSNMEMSYNLVDHNPYLGLSYYRLSQTDYDGKFEVFNPISVEVSNEHTIGLHIVPNPAIDNIHLELVYPNDHPINHDVKIYNSKGEEVYKMFYIGELEEFNIDIQKFTPGYYIVKSKSDYLKGEGKFIKK
tara:strand:- start:35 stop:1606 length:1572 start_codon:yes stop_codon:yes gene_type:complete